MMATIRAPPLSRGQGAARHGHGLAQGAAQGLEHAPYDVVRVHAVQLPDVQAHEARCSPGPEKTPAPAPCRSRPPSGAGSCASSAGRAGPRGPSAQRMSASSMGRMMWP